MKKPPKPYRQRKSIFTGSYGDAYQSNSYRMNETDKELLSHLYKHGCAVMLCKSEMSARYYAMRIRVIVARISRDISKGIKVTFIEDETVAWTLDRFPQTKWCGAVDVKERAHACMAVTRMDTLPTQATRRLREELREVTKKEKPSMILETEEDVKKYIEGRGEEEEGGE